MTDDSLNVAGQRPRARRRAVLIVTADAALMLSGIALAQLFLSRGSSVLPSSADAVGAWLFLATASATLFATGVTRVSWRHVALRDIITIAKALAAATLISLVALVAAQLMGLAVGSAGPLVGLCAPFAFLFTSGARLGWRMRYMPSSVGAGRPTLIVGAGGSGVRVARSILETSASARYMLVGFVDDDPRKLGQTMAGAPVLASTHEIAQTVRANGVKTVIIAVSEAPAIWMRRVADSAKEGGAEDIRVVPAVQEILDGRVSFAATRSIAVADLLGRKPVNLETEEIETFIGGRAVLVTGAAGTIGSELCRQAARFAPRRLLLLDIDESRLHDITLEIREAFPALEVKPILSDIREWTAIKEIFVRERPAVVLHAAAYKHVPMMEEFPCAGLEVNVLGTLNVVNAARAAGTNSFVLISTDKAADPSSIMGATKRLAEILALEDAEGNTMPVCTSVRFGNVLASRGSVIQTFERQLKQGRPITVTHPDVERYFMLASEAASLVLQAGAMGKGGEIFVLDMGEPVKILDMARDFVRLHGLKPDTDVPIVFTGLRPGEKMTEVLTSGAERLTATRHPRIRLIARAERQPLPADTLSQIRRITHDGSAAAAVHILSTLFPSLRSFAHVIRPTEGPFVPAPEGQVR